MGGSFTYYITTSFLAFPFGEKYKVCGSRYVTPPYPTAFNLRSSRTKIKAASGLISQAIVLGSRITT